jgi:hypothetical protein
MTNQITLPLEPTLAVIHPSLKACVASGVYQRGIVTVAGKIDRQPSHLSEALSGNDRRRFDVDDLEAYISATGDVSPIHYLIAKFLRDPAAVQQEAMAKIASIAETLPALLAAAGLNTGRRR